MKTIVKEFMELNSQGYDTIKRVRKKKPVIINGKLMFVPYFVIIPVKDGVYERKDIRLG